MFPAAATPSPASLHRDRLSQVVVLFLCVATFLHVAGPVTTNDLFWHIKTGEHLWEVGSFPTRDVFSYTTADLDWYLHEWLTQLIFFGLHEVGGFPLLRLFTGVAAVGILWQVHRLACRSLNTPWLSAVIVAVFAVLGVCRFQTRPTLFSMAIFIALTTWLLGRRERFGARQAAIVWATTLLWVNLHSVGLLSLIVFLAYAGGRLAHRWTGHPQPPNARELAWLAVTACGTFAVSLCNPKGILLYGFAFQDKEQVMNFVADEWGAFQLSFAANATLSFPAYATILAILAITVIAYFATGLALNPQPKKLTSTFLPDPVGLAFLAITLAGGLMARRFHWFLVITLILALRQLARLHRHGGLPAIKPLPGRAIATATALLLCGSLYHVEFRHDGRSLHANLIDSGYYGRDLATALNLPGIRFMKESGLEGNSFCHYGSGGMLSYALYPEVRVFIDSRADLYRRKVMLDFLTIRDGHPDQQKTLDAYGTDIYFRHWEIAPLREAELWTKVYTGPDGEIFLRRKPENLHNLERCKRWHESRGSAGRPPR